MTKLGNLGRSIYFKTWVHINNLTNNGSKFNLASGLTKRGTVHPRHKVACLIPFVFNILWWVFTSFGRQQFYSTT